LKLVFSQFWINLVFIFRNMWV